MASIQHPIAFLNDTSGEILYISCSFDDAQDPTSICQQPLQLAYIPSLAGNSIYLAIFVLCLLIQIFFAIRHKTWGFLAGMIGGVVLEAAGYLGRIMLNMNVFNHSAFLLYLICLTIGPAFLSAAIYLCLARIIVVYGENIARFSPRTYTITFMFCDFFSLVLQAAGGGLAATAASGDPIGQTGINIMIAGLAFQVFSLVLFMIGCADFAFSAMRRKTERPNAFNLLRNSLMFKLFLGSLALATLCIFVRSCFRVAELSQGFHGTLANQEVTFMILEGLMIVVAVLCLTAFHPGTSFAGQWHDANFPLRGRKKDKIYSEGSSTADVGKNGHRITEAHV